MSSTTITTGAATPAALDAGDLCEAFSRTVLRWGDAPALRASDGSLTLSWTAFDQCMRDVAGGLAALGVERGGTVAMLLTNRYEAAVVDMATLYIGAVPLSVYNSSSPAQLGYLLSDSRTDVLVTEAALEPKARQAFEGMATPPLLVVVDGGEATGAAAASLSELCGLGTPLAAGVRPQLTPEDLITVVYTSGTTGEPKGAELTHFNILEQIRGLHSLGRLPEGGSAVSYLPFAHMGDRLCAYYMPVVTGACITYHPDPRTAADLLPEIQPTLYMAVPRIWQRLQNAAVAKMAEATDAERAALEEAVALGGRLHDDRVAGREVDAELAARWTAHDPVLSTIRRAIGMDAGELLFTGAAPLPPETLRFFAAIGVDLCECYGQSETAGIILCNPADRPRPLTNGLPLPGVEAKLADDGELLLKGPMVMAGYRGKPELTAAAFDADGWLLTGDVFRTDEAGYYRIVDRKKEIIVSSTGKNISPVLVENAVSSACPLVGSVVCLGDGQPYTAVMIALEPEGTAALTGGTDPRENAQHPEVIARLTTALRSANEGLNASEQVRRFAVVDSTWLPGSDELTPTMKLKRRPIAAKYDALIAQLYGPPSDTVVDVMPAGARA
ncbi:Long-chain-fatty-acid--CoA ligase FadD15 [Paraconexibacter sp. AEG42_29]|uniref:Long-chain-fatty-acid--CoA ligase FadD15 n=1 Tax=Paraconexibacter sp. AEG42_29 TaxID=2997339 RepID=A0AAU7B3P6_9ACTN